MKRPLVTLKLATSLDGRIALCGGQSRWITSPDSREHSHALRAAHAAIVIGSRTATADDPSLTVRHVCVPDPPPTRIVVSSSGDLTPHCRLIRTVDEAPLVLATTGTADMSALCGLRAAGVTLWRCDQGQCGVALSSLLEQCVRAGLDSLLIEGGGQLAASFVREALIDRIEWFRAPVLIGADGISGIGELGLIHIEQMPRFTCIGRVELGDDIWETYKPL